ncbi:MAG TPA: hypothetical protein VHE37_11905 [Nevskiaceae bacterium]|nr:hypothetical protein [Nevskiaceae bacterium]
MVGGIPIEFLLFALTLVGVAVLHDHALWVALAGLGAVLGWKLATQAGFAVAAHLAHEAPELLNLFGLLLGFALLARHFERSEIPDLLPRLLPRGWPGNFALLGAVFVMSAFLDNIAAAMIGGMVARHVYGGRVDIGFVAAIVAASNAGGAGSVLGDTTTTMLWIAGVSWRDVLYAYLAAVPALLFFGIAASLQQERTQAMTHELKAGARLRLPHLVATVLVLLGALAANVMFDFPAAGVWTAILICSSFATTDWLELREASRGAVFLLALVACASLMPVERLPPASMQTTLALGLVSAVFDNIPLTKLALEQGGYDWGALAYCVGFGGSMIWFGSSAGVAISGEFPQSKSVLAWVARGWHVIAGYFIGYASLMLLSGWQPHLLAR